MFSNNFFPNQTASQKYSNQKNSIILYIVNKKYFCVIRNRALQCLVIIITRECFLQKQTHCKTKNQYNL